MLYPQETPVLESLFKKVADLKAYNFIKKKPPHRCFPVNIVKFLRTTFLYNTSGGCLWQYYHCKVSWGVCSLIPHFHVLSMLIKYLKSCIINSLLSCNKTIFSLLELIDTCFQLQSMFRKKISCFLFWWKTYTKRCTNNYVIRSVKRLPLLSLCGLSSAFNFRIWSGKWKNAV